MQYVKIRAVKVVSMFCVFFSRGTLLFLTFIDAEDQLIACVGVSGWFGSVLYRNWAII